MDSKPTDPHSLREHLKDEMIDAVDEEIELEIDDSRLAEGLLADSDAKRQPRHARSSCLFQGIAAAAEGADQASGLGRLSETETRRAVRGPGCRRQGRSDQAGDAAAESAHLQGRGAIRANRARAHAMVFPALCGTSARGGRNRAVRSQLVQPRRRRAGDGILHGSRMSGILSHRARIRTHAGQFRHHSGEILVLDHRRGAESCAF